MLLIHGFAASADWWMFTAPFLARGRRVVALSLSSGGRSGWRDSYDIEQWTREAVGVAQARGVLDGGPAVIAAHSFGGTAGAGAATALGKAVAAFIALDRPIDQLGRNWPGARGPKPPSRFTSPEEAVAHYRTRPMVLDAEPAVMAHVAKAAVRRLPPEEGGEWVWRQDPAFRTKMLPGSLSMASDLAAMHATPTFLRGAHSELFTLADAQEVRDGGMDVIEIPGANHHLMLDQPLAVCVAIDAIARAALSR